MRIIDSWVEPGTALSRRGTRLFHVRFRDGGEVHELCITGKELAKKVGKPWKNIYEQGRRSLIEKPSTFNAPLACKTGDSGPQEAHQRKPQAQTQLGP